MSTLPAPTGDLVIAAPHPRGWFVIDEQGRPDAYIAPEEIRDNEEE